MNCGEQVQRRGGRRKRVMHEQVERRGGRRKRMSAELARDEGLSAEQEIMRVMKSILDRFQQEMVKRFTRLKEMNAKFGSLQDTVHLMEVEHQGSTDATLRLNCKDLGTVCHTGFDGTELCAEICNCRMSL